MKKMKSLLIFFGLMAFLSAIIFAQDKNVKKVKKQESENHIEQGAMEVFKQHCAVSGCHRGAYPKKGLNLEPDKFKETLLNKPSRQLESLKLLDTKNPDKSYLLMKIKGTEGIIDAKMPTDSPPLTIEEIEAIEKWVRSLAEKKSEKKKEVKTERKQ